MSVDKERRSGQRELSSVLKRQLNDAQLMTLRGLEGFGWELKFIRRKPFQEPIAVIFDGDRKTFAVLEADGSLNEKPAARPLAAAAAEAEAEAEAAAAAEAEAAP